MVWIHGGVSSTAALTSMNARRLTTRGGHRRRHLQLRLGALGFLAHPALGPAGQVGSYGLADQQAALRWVRDNIANFGGDPGKVTVAGESAGGIIGVLDHLVAPGSAGLFRAAIIHSAPCQAQGTRTEAEKTSLDYAGEAGCGNPTTAAKCLRDLRPTNCTSRRTTSVSARDLCSRPSPGQTPCRSIRSAGSPTGAAPGCRCLIGSNRG